MGASLLALAKSIYYISMDLLQAHWFLERKNLLFHSLQIWITKILLVNSDVPYSIQNWHQVTAS